MELNILSSFSFDKYHINLLTVEHNEPHIGSEYRNNIRQLLEKNNFSFVKGNDPINGWNHGPIEDYYVNNIWK